MKSNHAILSKYKEVPAGSVKLGSTTTSYLNGKEITDQIFTSGSFDRHRMLNAVTGSSSLHFKTSNSYGANSPSPGIPFTEKEQRELRKYLKEVEQSYRDAQGIVYTKDHNVFWSYYENELNWKGSEDIPDFILAELTGNAKPDIIGEMVMDFVIGGGFFTAGVKGLKAASTISKSKKYTNARHANLSKGIDNLPSNINYTNKQLQKKFKHADDFGVSGNFNKNNATKFMNTLDNHIKNADNVFSSKISGVGDVNVYIRDKNLAVFTDKNGNFVSGWRLSQDQLDFHTKHFGTRIK